MPEAVQTADAIAWQDVESVGVEGKAWQDVGRFYDRLPARAEATVTEAVWRLSHEPAGLAVRFVSDSPDIHARWTLADPLPSPSHHHPCSHSGVDLYGRDDQGVWRWLATGDPWKHPTVDKRLAQGIDPGTREYMLYLPLRNPVNQVEIGVPDGQRLHLLPPRGEKPIVYYGTSIVHGVGASRTGMAHPAIVARRFDRPHINLGFAGNARMELAVADLLGELDPVVFVIDALPNMGPELVDERAAPFVRRLREHRPQTPIVLVEDRTHTHSWAYAQRREFHAQNHAALKRAYHTLRDEGVQGLWYVADEPLLGEDGEGTIDGSHPTDLGMHRQATIMMRVLAPILAHA